MNKQPILTWVSLSFMILLAFQDCSKMRSTAGPTGAAQGFSNVFAIESVTNSTTSSCDQLSKLNGTGQDVSSVFQSCVDQSRGGTLIIPPGVYTIAHAVSVTGPIHIKTTTDGFTCSENDSRCPHFLSVNETDFPANVALGAGLFDLNGSNIIIENMIFDGNRQNRYGSVAQTHCQSTGYLSGIVTFNGSNIVFRGNVLENALCGTSSKIYSGDNILIENNRIENNGKHTLQSMWSDGLTIADPTHLTVHGNYFADNTDVDMVFGGCRNCVVTGNTFYHDGGADTASFSAMHIHHWPNGTSGDFSDSIFSNNTINCNFGCGFGIGIGGDSWYLDSAGYNVDVENNTISGAIIALSLDELGKYGVVKNNVIDKIAEGSVVCGWPLHSVAIAAISFSPTSYPYLTDDSQIQFDWLQTQLASSGDFVFRQMDGCIPDPAKATITTTKSIKAIVEASFTTAGRTPSSSADSVLADNPVLTQYVEGLYQGLMGRKASDQDAAFWVHAAINANRNCTELAESFLNSNEQNQYSAILGDRAFVTSLYLGIYQRSPDNEGLNYWTSQLQAGNISRTNLELEFLKAAEFKSVCQKYDLN